MNILRRFWLVDFRKEPTPTITRKITLPKFYVSTRYHQITRYDLTIFFIETTSPTQAAFSGYGFTVCLPQMSFVIFSSIMVCDNG
jgi:hypothetical protein